MIREIIIGCVKDVVEERYGVCINRVDKKERYNVAEARGVAVLVTRILFGIKYSEIAKHLKLNKMTAIFAADRVEERSKTDKILRKEITEIIKIVKDKTDSVLSD